MIQRNVVRNLLVIILVATLYGCASPKPVMYQGVPSTTYLKQNTDTGDKNLPYVYEIHKNFIKYDKMIIAPVTIYRDKDSQFGDMAEKDKMTLVTYAQAQFTEKMKSKFQITTLPGPTTLILKVILTGAETSTPVLSTLSRLDLGGGLYNGVQSIRGGEGSFTGAIFYVVEIYDSSTSKLLSAYIAKEYPNSMNIAASLGSLTAAKVGIEKGAEKLAKQLQQTKSGTTASQRMP